MQISYEVYGQRFELDVTGAPSPTSLAMICGRDFFHEHDGWEASWPIPFQLFDSDGMPSGTFSVDMEAEPQFIAEPICSPDPTTQKD